MSNMAKSNQILDFKKYIKKEENDRKVEKKMLEENFKKFKKKNDYDWMKTYERNNKLISHFEKNRDKHKWCWSSLSVKNQGPYGFNYLACKRNKGANCENYD
tara:strand:- start:579 stop:884 length:306 start_codon:yes stop_codon:yes gene_type:complete